MRKFNFNILGILILTSLLAPAQDSEAYYAKHWSIALSPEPQNGYYQITTFIPTRYLLFIEDRNDFRKIGSQDYLYATTQDDVPVLVLVQTVSEQPFRKSVGRHQVIFNCPYDLCRTEGCDRNDTEQLWQIVAGEAFEMVNFEEDEMITLRGMRINNDILTGYININELHILHRQGIITRTDVPHPYYNIQRTEVANIGTDCSQIKNAGYEEPLGNQPELEKLVLEAFGIGRVKTGVGNIIFEKEIGAGGEKTAFFVYDIENRRVTEKYRMVAAVTYMCREKGISETPVRIKKVHLKNLMTEQEHFLDFEKYKSPDVLLNHLNSPYLFSVNTYQHYIDLIKRLGDEFENRALAGYFLSEFNVSCRSLDRSRGEIRGYSYRED
jgi:hypothetical protein